MIRCSACFHECRERAGPRKLQRSVSAPSRNPRAATKEVGYRQPKRLSPERPPCGDIHCLCARIRIHGLGERRRRAHPVATITLGNTRYVTIEARHSRHDDLVAIGLVHPVAQTAADGAERNSGKPFETRNRSRFDTRNRRPETGVSAIRRATGANPQPTLPWLPGFLLFTSSIRFLVSGFDCFLLKLSGFRSPLSGFDRRHPSFWIETG
jgi:hypothetical protein